MWPNPQFPAKLVTFTKEIFNGKLHFLCGVSFNFSALPRVTQAFRFEMFIVSTRVEIEYLMITAITLKNRMTYNRV